MTTPSAPPQTPPAASGADVPRAKVLPTVFAVVVGAFAFFFAGGDMPGIIAALVFPVAFIAGRAVAPIGAATPLGARALGVTLSAVAWGALLFAIGTRTTGLLDDETLLPLVWSAAVGAGVSLIASHKRLTAVPDDAPPGGPRPDEATERRFIMVAVTAFAVGFLALGWGAFNLLNALVEAPRLNLLLGAAFGLFGIKRMLDFAARAPGARAETRGFGEWLRANWLAVAALAIVLVAYTAYRDRLAAELPYFPFLEFGLGMAVFTFALGRLRHTLARRVTEAPVASERRPHAARVDVATEPEYEALRHPVTTFVETGHGVPDYTQAVRTYARLQDDEAQRYLAPVAAYRREPRVPALPLAWSIAATGAATVGLALAAFTLFIDIVDAGAGVARAFFVLALGLGVYRLQDPLRKHALPGGAVAFAGAGVAILFLAFILMVLEDAPLTAVPLVVWGIVGGVATVLVGIPVAASARVWQRLRKGEPLPEPPESVADEVKRGLDRARRRGTTWLVGTVVAAFVAPPVIATAAAAVPGDVSDFLSGFLEFYASLVPFLVFAGLGIAAGAGVRAIGFTRAKTGVLARAERRRAERLGLHREVMTRLAASRAASKP